MESFFQDAFQQSILSISGVLLLLFLGFVARKSKFVIRILGFVHPPTAAKMESESVLSSERSTYSRTEKAKKSWGEMHQVLRTRKYLKWQCEQVAEMHAETIGSLAALGADCLPEVSGTMYPIVCLGASNHRPPTGTTFTSLLLGSNFDDNRTEDFEPLAKKLPVTINTGTPKDTNIRQSYFNLLRDTGTVRRWNQRGFELSTLQVDEGGNVGLGRAGLITYGQNCLTSHVLGYELYLKYIEVFSLKSHIKLVGSSSRVKKGDEISLRPVLSLDSNNRLSYEKYVSNKPEAHEADSGKPLNFHPLISVQALVLFKENGVWFTWSMRRSDDVAAMAGFWQFPPAGGFELFGDEKCDYSEVAGQFNLEEALIREFFEEIFMDEDLTSDIPKTKMMGHRQSPGFSCFKELASTGKIEMHFLGVVLDLVSLRSEYSFLIIAEDASDLKKLSYGEAGWGKGSSESTHMKDVSLIEVSDLIASNDYKWNPSSVGLFRLFSKLALDSQSWLRVRWPDMRINTE